MKYLSFLDHVNIRFTEHFVSKEAKNATLLDKIRAKNGEISLQMKTAFTKLSNYVNPILLFCSYFTQAVNEEVNMCAVCTCCVFQARKA